MGVILPSVDMTWKLFRCVPVEKIIAWALPVSKEWQNETLTWDVECDVNLLSKYLECGVNLLSQYVGCGVGLVNFVLVWVLWSHI